MIEAITLIMTEYFLPEDDIDIVRNFDSPEYNYNIGEYGDHIFYVDNNDIKNKRKTQPIIIDQSYEHEIRKSDHSRRFTTI